MRKKKLCKEYTIIDSKGNEYVSSNNGFWQYIKLDEENKRTKILIPVIRKKDNQFGMFDVNCGDFYKDNGKAKVVLI